MALVSPSHWPHALPPPPDPWNTDQLCVALNRGSTYVPCNSVALPDVYALYWLFTEMYTRMSQHGGIYTPLTSIVTQVSAWNAGRLTMVDAWVYLVNLYVQMRLM